MRKKTNNEFLKELKKINPDIQPLEEYINAKTKIKVKCNICDYVWGSQPDNLLQGYGCPKCAGNARLTNEEFLEKLGEINPNISVLEKYSNYNTKIKVRCNICNTEWKSKPGNLLNNRGCLKCSIKKVHKLQSKTNKQFVEELKELSPELEPLECYTNNWTPIKIKCTICELIFIAKPKNLLNKGTRCPNLCTRPKNSSFEEQRFADGIKEGIDEYIKLKEEEKMGKKLTNEEFLKRFNAKYKGRIVALTEYVKYATKIKFKCNECGDIFYAKGYDMLQYKYGCANCNGNKKRTREEFVELMKEVDPTIEIIGTYINNNTRILCRCKKCGNEWYAEPKRLLAGNGCNSSECISEKIRNSRLKYDTESFKKIAKENYPNLELLDEYYSYDTKVKFLCKDCGEIWEVKPSSVIRKTLGNCPNCISKYRLEKHLSKLSNYSDFNFKVLDKQINWRSDIECICKKCKTKVVKELQNINNNGIICRTCNPTGSVEENKLANEVKEEINKFIELSKILTVSKKKTNEEFLEELHNINPSIEPLEEYKGANTEITFKCNTCGHIFKTTPGRILHTKYGCPKCAIEARTNDRTKTSVEFIKEISEINPDIEILEDYKTSHIKLKVRCKKCKTEFKIMPYKVLSRQAILCRTCNPTGSMEEQRLADNLTEEINKQTNELKELYKMERNVRMSDLSGRQFEIDIYFPNLKLGVEYDGVYYHSDKVRYARYILDKKEFFWDNFGIHIIFVNSIEYNYNPDIVQDKIMSALNIYKKLAYARKLKVIEVDYETSTEFLELNHIQGGDSSGVRFGLVTKKTNVLVALMTFSKVRNIVKSKSDAEDTYELVRYCVMKGLKITGGFSKLLKHAENYLKSIGVKYIKTFADRRFTKDSDNVYLRNGFELSNISGQNYLYFKNGEVLTRYQCQKHKLRNLLGEENFDESMTERENMLFNGYSIYWDCGNLVYYKEIAKP